jgi:L-amino acid N-acyltransferase YncA
MAVRLRHADHARDAAACAAIYSPFVRHGAVSFEETAPDTATMAQRIERTSRTHPWLVATGPEDTPIGFAYAAPHRLRAAYRWAVEVSVYVDRAQHRRGVGRALYGALMPLLARQGLFVALAGITLPNAASVSLHESLGFRLIGIYPQIGFKAGAWRDVGWWQLELRSRPDGTPEDPGPPSKLQPDEPDPGPSG